MEFVSQKVRGKREALVVRELVNAKQVVEGVKQELDRESGFEGRLEELRAKKRDRLQALRAVKQEIH